MSKRETSTGTIEAVIPAALTIGDKLANEFETTKDLKTIEKSLSSYNIAIRAANSVLTHKKLTGYPVEVKYMLDKNRE